MELHQLKFNQRDPFVDELPPLIFIETFWGCNLRCGFCPVPGLSTSPEGRCDCAPPPPPAAALEEAAAVFRGTVTAIERVDARVQVTFALAAVWKGPVGETTTVFTGLDQGDCGLEFFRVGGDYLVYAEQSGEDLITHQCTRTGPFDSEEAAALGPPVWTARESIDFVRGDANSSGQVDISDGIRIVNRLFLGAPWQISVSRASTR